MSIIYSSTNTKEWVGIVKAAGLRVVCPTVEYPKDAQLSSIKNKEIVLDAIEHLIHDCNWEIMRPLTNDNVL